MDVESSELSESSCLKERKQEDITSKHHPFHLLHAAHISSNFSAYILSGLLKLIKTFLFASSLTYNVYIQQCCCCRVIEKVISFYLIMIIPVVIFIIVIIKKESSTLKTRRTRKNRTAGVIFLKHRFPSSANE